MNPPKYVLFILLPLQGNKAGEPFFTVTWRSHRLIEDCQHCRHYSLQDFHGVSLVAYNLRLMTKRIVNQNRAAVVAGTYSREGCIEHFPNESKALSMVG